MKNKKQENDILDKINKFAESCEVVKVDISKTINNPELIIKEIKNLDSSKMSEEILIWLIKNVENYINNQTTIFKIDIVLDHESSTVQEMEELKKLQNLYQSLPDDNKKITDKARNSLDNVTNDVFESIQTKKELLKQLFTRMAFYYELKGISKGRQLIQELDGNVSINKFEYESFSVGVKVRKMEYAQRESGEERVIQDKHVIKEYTIPEGFTLELEIAFSPKELPKGLF